MNSYTYPLVAIGLTGAKQSFSRKIASYLSYKTYTYKSYKYYKKILRQILIVKELFLFAAGAAMKAKRHYSPCLTQDVLPKRTRNGIGRRTHR